MAVLGEPGARVMKRQSTLSVIDQLTLSWQDVSFHVTDRATKNRRDLVSHNTGFAKPGELLAIMGPSGSGKSVLLDCLAKRSASGQTEGNITINGQQRPSEFNRMSMYVQQTDMLVPTLTVRESLWYAAEFQLSKQDRSAKDAIINDIIDVLGLRNAENTKVGNALIRGLSGGQKRRLSIGVQLVAAPLLMFLDGPTNGLDSTAALATINALSNLAHQGRTVVMAIDQPSTSIFKLVDRVLLLVGGKTLFFGTTAEALSFFNSNGHPVPQIGNPADFYLRKINADFPGASAESVSQLLEAYKTSSLSQQNAAESLRLSSPQGQGKLPALMPPTSFGKQFVTHMRRSILHSIRNPIQYWVRVAMYTMLGFMMGTLWIWDRRRGHGTDFGNDHFAYGKTQDRWSLLAFIQGFFTFMVIAVGPAMVEDLQTMQFERASGWYGVPGYSLMGFLSPLPWLALITVTSLLPVHYMADFNDKEGRLAWRLLLLFLGFMTAENMMACVVAVLPHSLLAIAMGSMVKGMDVLFMGFLCIAPNIPDWWIWYHYMDPNKYLLGGFLYNEFAGMKITNVPLPGGGFQPVMRGEDFIDTYFDIKRDVRGDYAAILFCMAVILRLMATFLMHHFRNRKF
eukprot:TRINITY_DN6655_c0_g1_i1.p2 TRINITY_DN6655_c0_g1~~TRINITY_DN6655_c0_g1_i1.p2  ORF type:complete len:638 (+),score=174.74 TRINITY_DN6655_c0_g1_i1:40-1914(+)